MKAKILALSLALIGMLAVTSCTKEIRAYPNHRFLDEGTETTLLLHPISKSKV